MTDPIFRSFSIQAATLYDDRACDHPTIVRGFLDEPLDLPADGTHFGFVHDAGTQLEYGGRAYDLAPGMYFSVPGSTRLAGGRGLVVTRLGYRGVFALGGPIEPRGRLRYIDGCSDSLLLAPPVKGDPCLNHLHIPAGTHQTRHTHPTLRAGIIARGSGRCVTPEESHPLQPGLVFVLQPDGAHNFFTDDETLDVVVYHPDSDTGPTHEDHPMINRTIIGNARPDR